MALRRQFNEDGTVEETEIEDVDVAFPEPEQPTKAQLLARIEDLLAAVKALKD